MSNIYHITSQTEWDKQKEAPVYTAESLETEGFIHASNVDQIVPTANLIFQGRTDLLILTIDIDLLSSEVKVEDTYGHGAHPHIYGPVDRAAIVFTVAFPPNKDGTFSLPKL